MLTFTIPIRTVQAMLKVAPKRDARRDLCAINIDLDARVVSATDGVMALVIRDKRIVIEEGEPRRVAIERGVFDDVLRGISKRAHDQALCVEITPPTGHEEDHLARVTRADGVSSIARTVQRFPDIARVVPSYFTGEPLAMDYAKVATLAEAISIAYGRPAFPALTFSEPGRTATMTWKELPESFGLVMPRIEALPDADDVMATIKRVYAVGNVSEAAAA